MDSVLKILIASLILAGFVSFWAIAQDEEALKAYYSLETEDPTDESGNNLHGAPEGVPNLIDGAVVKAWEFRCEQLPDFGQQSGSPIIACFQDQQRSISIECYADLELIHPAYLTVTTAHPPALE